MYTFKITHHTGEGEDRFQRWKKGGRISCDSGFNRVEQLDLVTPIFRVDNVDLRTSGLASLRTALSDGGSGRRKENFALSPRDLITSGGIGTAFDGLWCRFPSFLFSRCQDIQ